MPELHEKLTEVLAKYHLDVDSLSFKEQDKIACLAAGLFGALEGSRMLGLRERGTLGIILVAVGAAYNMGRQGASGLELHVESEPFGNYMEVNEAGEALDQQLLTPSQVDVKNHINLVAGLDRKWVPA